MTEPTKEMIEAALAVMNEPMSLYASHEHKMRAALIAAEKAAWRRFEDYEAPDGHTETPFYFSNGVATSYDDEGNPTHLVFYAGNANWSETTHWRPLPSQPEPEA